MRWAGVEATYVPSAPHHGWLALWTPEPGKPVDGADADLELVVLAGTQARRRTVPVRRLELGDAIDDLVCLPATADVSACVRAWAVAARLAVDLAARGRLLPSVAADGSGTWVLGPLDAADVARRAELAAALPPAAHALPVAGSKPLRVVPANLSAPDLVDVETVAVLRKRWLAGALTDRRFAAALDDLEAIDLDRYPTLALIGRSYQLRANVTAYDAMYVALAEMLRCELSTGDQAVGEHAWTSVRHPGASVT